MEIDWVQFSWEAFSTLVAGLAAVVGATMVGVRQARISARQTDILAQQTELSELTYRAELFERRLGVYDAVSDFLGSILRHAHPPNHELERLFLRAERDARFLFAESVHTDLQEIWKRASAYRVLHSVSRHTFEVEGHYGPGNPEKEADALNWFAERFRTLPDLFGEELRLGRVGESSAGAVHA